MRGRVRPLIAVVLAVAAMGLVSACNPEDTPLQRSTTLAGDPACQVGVIGDSLTVGARDLGGLVGRFGSVGCAVVNVDARVSRPAAEGASIAEAWAAWGVMPRILVVAVGTNDCSRGAMTAAVRRVLAAAGPDRPVVWVNTYRRGCDGPVNGALFDVQNELAARPDGGNLWVLDHWGAIRADPGQLARDGVHLTAAGYRAHADRIVRAVAG